MYTHTRSRPICKLKHVAPLFSREASNDLDMHSECAFLDRPCFSIFYPPTTWHPGSVLFGQVGGGHKACRADPKAAQEEAGDAAQHASGGDGVPGREGVSWFSFIPVIPNRNNTFSNGRGRNWRQNTFRTFSKVFYLANWIIKTHEIQAAKRLVMVSPS